MQPPKLRSFLGVSTVFLAISPNKIMAILNFDFIQYNSDRSLLLVFLQFVSSGQNRFLIDKRNLLSIDKRNLLSIIPALSIKNRKN